MPAKAFPSHPLAPVPPRAAGDSRLLNYRNYETLRYLLSNLRWWIEEYRSGWLARSYQRCLLMLADSCWPVH